MSKIKDNFNFMLLADGSLYCTAAKFSSNNVSFDNKVILGGVLIQGILNRLPTTYKFKMPPFYLAVQLDNLECIGNDQVTLNQCYIIPYEDLYKNNGRAVFECKDLALAKEDNLNIVSANGTADDVIRVYVQPSDDYSDFEYEMVCEKGEWWTTSNEVPGIFMIGISSSSMVRSIQLCCVDEGDKDTLYSNNNIPDMLVNSHMVVTTAGEGAYIADQWLVQNSEQFIYISLSNSGGFNVRFICDSDNDSPYLIYKLTFLDSELPDFEEGSDYGWWIASTWNYDQGGPGPAPSPLNN